MTKNMFDLDDELLEDNKDYADELKKANLLCMREQYDKALAIYNKILDEDMENEAAYIGILKVHSECYTKYDSKDIEKDIRIIERLFPETMDEEYAAYCLERKKHLKDKPKEEPKEELKKPEEKPKAPKAKASKPKNSASAEEIFDMAVKYYLGNGVPKDYDKAFEYTKEAAELGCENAEHNLGAFYESGIGTSKDFDKALYWYEKAAMHGDPTKAYWLGYKYYNGQVAPKDFSKAIYWYEKAIKGGSSDAKLNLGFMYFNGDGLNKNVAKAYELWAEAASEGNISACYNLGLCYEYGYGVAPNRNLAIKNYEIAYNGGFEA